MTDTANRNHPGTQHSELLILKTLMVVAEAGGSLRRELLAHCGIDLAVMATPFDIPAAVLEHYRTSTGQYDFARFEHDVRTWPAIAEHLNPTPSEKETL